MKGWPIGIEDHVTTEKALNEGSIGGDRVADLRRKRKNTAPPLGYKKTGRPANYRELGELLAAGVEFEFAWGDFLHEFYAHQMPELFLEPSPEILSPEYRAQLAGAAEFLSIEFELPMPLWISRPEFFLDHEWDILSELLGEEAARYREGAGPDRTKCS